MTISIFFLSNYTQRRIVNIVSGEKLKSSLLWYLCYLFIIIIIIINHLFFPLGSTYLYRINENCLLHKLFKIQIKILITIQIMLFIWTKASFHPKLEVVFYKPTILKFPLIFHSSLVPCTDPNECCMKNTAWTLDLCLNS